MIEIQDKEYHMKPVVIAIPETGNSLYQKYLKGKYVKSLQHAGAVVRWIDLTDPESAVKEALDADGLLLAGGADIDPALYGMQREQKCEKPDPVRDLAEPMILKAFFNMGKPILGVCRGMQMINAAFVNSLHHQAVDCVGAGLRAVAKSKDGFVEALEIADCDFGFAVQWHPEHMSKVKAQQNLIAAFVQSCRYRNAE